MMPKLTEPVGHRLSKECHVEGDCLIWTGQKSTYGYGQIRHNGRTHNCHRLVYEMIHGPVQKGLFVCHECDNPACIHPDHLWAGTPKDNTHDCIAKGRHVANRYKSN